MRELDLLFYHRKLRRLVAVELKVGPFEPEFKGQMEYYLRWLDHNEREPGEEAPIGLILCSEAHPEDVSLMGLDRGDIRVARYITENLPPPLLEKKLREVVARHREFQAREAQSRETPARQAAREQKSRMTGKTGKARTAARNANPAGTGPQVSSTRW